MVHYDNIPNRKTHRLRMIEKTLKGNEVIYATNIFK